MTHDDAFLQAIIEAPADDTPRLIYADWLDDHGQPDRAAFIRLQCELARLPEDDPRRPELEGREQELLRVHLREWAEPVARHVNARTFRRGFVEEVTARPEVFLEHADALFQAAPIRRVNFQTTMFQLAWPQVTNPSAGPLLPQLAACRHLARLNVLSFWNTHIGDAGVGALAASPFLAGLRLLDLRMNDVADAGLAALAGSPRLPRLNFLELGGNNIGPAGAQALAASEHLTGLVALDLEGNPIGDAGVQALAASPNLGRLAKLGLPRTGMGTAGARALASSLYLAQLGRLDVADNAIGNKAREALRLRFGKGRCRF
jgi:uncharacterized protein (TIGR02996 family)